MKGNLKHSSKNGKPIPTIKNSETLDDKLND